jgi:HK97 family phage portal protein
LSLLERLGFRASVENPNTPLTASQLVDLLDLKETDAGVGVTERTSLRNSVVLACVRVIGETLGTLPLNVFQRLERGKRKATEHRLYSLLHDAPNPQMSSVTFREAVTAQVLLWGNGYAELQKDKAGRIIAIWPLPSDRTRPVRVNNDLVYETTVRGPLDDYIFQITNEPVASGQLRQIRPENVLHVPGLSFNGLVGLSPIQLAKQTLGVSIAAEKFGAKFFANGSRPSGIITHKNVLKPEARENIRKSFQDATTGDNARAAIVLEEGMQWTALTIPPDEAQFIETRKFQISEIARIFRVPLHLVQDLERSTNNNIEQQAIEFVMHTIRPWAVRWEQELNRKLFFGTQFFAEHGLEGLLRGDFKSRMEGYAVMRNIGMASVNDLRELESWNPIAEEDGGDVYLAPLNMVPLSVLAQQEELAEGPQDPDESTVTDPSGPASPTEALLRDRTVNAFRRLFVDGVRRMASREKREEKDARAIFSPILTALAETMLAASFSKPKLNATGQAFVHEYAGAMAAGAQEWKPEENRAIADRELLQAYYAIHGRLADIQEA